MSELCVKTRVKAKKAHRCGECGGQIVPNENYLRYSGFCEGKAFSHKMCECCSLILSEYVYESNCMDDEWPELGSLQYHLFESDMPELQEKFLQNQKARLATAGLGMIC